MTKVLIVGYGSIGKRHHQVYTDLGAKVAVISSQDLQGIEKYTNIQEALEGFQPNIVIIANKTSDHLGSVRSLREFHFSGPIFVEKPLSIEPTDENFKQVYVLYNLRFHPLILKLKKELENSKVILANAYCGQYLPSWRPNRNYEDIYSSKKSEGGGVLRDLSHEIDYCLFLLGKYKNISAMGGHFSTLKIDSDDCFSINAVTEQCALLNITVNYLNREAKRFIIINTDECTYELNFIEGFLKKDGVILMEKIRSVESYTYQAQAILSENFVEMCDFPQANHIMKVIQNAEESVHSGRSCKL